MKLENLYSDLKKCEEHIGSYIPLEIVLIIVGLIMIFCSGILFSDVSSFSSFLGIVFFFIAIISFVIAFVILLGIIEEFDERTKIKNEIKNIKNKEKFIKENKLFPNLKTLGIDIINKEIKDHSNYLNKIFSINNKNYYAINNIFHKINDEIDIEIYNILLLDNKVLYMKYQILINSEEDEINKHYIKLIFEKINNKSINTKAKNVLESSVDAIRRLDEAIKNAKKTIKGRHIEYETAINIIDGIEIKCEIKKINGSYDSKLDICIKNINLIDQFLQEKLEQEKQEQEKERLKEQEQKQKIEDNLKKKKEEINKYFQ